MISASCGRFACAGGALKDVQIVCDKRLPHCPLLVWGQVVLKELDIFVGRVKLRSRQVEQDFWKAWIDRDAISDDGERSLLPFERYSRLLLVERKQAR